MSRTVGTEKGKKEVDQVLRTGFVTVSKVREGDRR